VLLLLLASASWLRRDTAPPLWDSAHYLQHSAILYHALRDDGPRAFFAAFSSSMDRKAPLIAALPIPFYAVLGESHLSARYVNLIWIAVSSLFLFRLGRLLAGDATAVFAVVLLQTFPLVAGMSRQFLVEYGLMTFVILWMYYLVRWRRGDDRAAPWKLGAILGFGLLLKVTFVLYVAAPSVVVLLRGARDGRPKRSLVGDLARIAVVALPIAATWYVRNLFEVTKFVLDAGFGESARPYGTGPVLSLQAIATYWLKLINAGISGLYALVFLVILALLVLTVRRRPGSAAPEGRRGELRLLTVWWLVPFLALTLATNKDPRYSIAYLPSLALLFAEATTRLVPSRRQPAAFAAIAAVGILNFSAYSFGLPALQRDLRVGRLVLISGHTAWAHPPEADPWPGEVVPRAIATDAAVRFQNRPIRVRVLFSHPRINAHVLNYLATLHDLTPRFTTVHFQNRMALRELIGEIDTGYEYVLTKGGDLGPEHLNVRNREVASALERGELAFERLLAVPMPDGSQVLVHRRKKPAGATTRDSRPVDSAPTR
jgi:4-amino-4-deoxy-L-arabinose transferase-like glycosyltransferase